MFWELFQFELYYRRRRATTYVYFLIVSVFTFIVITGPNMAVTNASDATSANSPYTIGALMVVMSFAFSIITSSLVGVAVIRDVEHEMAPIIFTTPIQKGSYLFGRFAGSLVTLIFINSGIIVGALAGYFFGAMFKMNVAWHSKEMLPFDLWTYVQPFLLFVITNIFITGSLFFCAGALVRRPIVIYTQGVALLLLYQVANIYYLGDLDSQHTAAIIDPFCVRTYVYMTRYWTPGEQNTKLVPFESVLLYNRLIWMSIAAVVLLITYWRFSFTSRRGFSWRKKEQARVVEETPNDVSLPEVKRSSGLLSQAKQLASSTMFHFRGIWTEIPFVAIAGAGLVVLFINASRMDNVYGTSSYPTTSAVLTMLGSFGLFFTIIMIFYSGEITWKERQYKFQSITDVAPVSTGLVLFAKFLSLCLVYLTLLFGFFVFGISLQALNGYYYFDLKGYFGSLIGETFLNLALLTAIGILIQSLSGNKFLGFLLMVSIVAIINLLPTFGVEYEMFAYASGTLGVFSQMNGFGHFITPFLWLKTYWVALAILFFIPAIVFYQRGSERSMKMKWKAGKLQLTTGLKITGIIAALVFAGSGVYIYYNMSIINHYENSLRAKSKLVRYEKELKQFESKIQPKITEVNLAVDLYPDRRSFEAKGYYFLRNYDSLPVKQIQVQHMISPNLHLHDITFGRTARTIEEHTDLGYRVFEIDPPLASGDSLRMEFAVEFTQEGFRSKPQNTDLVYNGTFFRDNYFPTVGYDSHQELSNGEDRRRFALNSPAEAKATGNRTAINIYGKEADRIRFKVVVSTENNQVAIAPGNLTKEWFDNNRHYLQYETHETIPAFYAILSGRYEKKVDKWNDVDLEIYYHPAHQFNIARMMQGLKDGLDYYTKNFGAFPDSQVRIIEFPRYSTLAQSFPGTIAFSEGVGFILKVADPNKDLDVPYYVTAHELAHQWWGQQVMEADTAGYTMLSEGMSQYSALMVMKQTFPPEMMQLFLKYELDAYLKGRATEKLREVPLQYARDQQYIAYNKSALAFFAMQDFIGEKNLNTAFRRFYEKYAYKGPPYPRSKDLIAEIRKVTPDSLSYLVTDMFESVTLYQNKTVEAAYSILSPGRYEATMTVSTEKFRVNSKETDINMPLNDWIDIGVYGEDENGKEKLIYLKKHKFTRQKTTLVIPLTERPVKVGIDPLHKLIDQQSTDNVINVGTVVELANTPLGY
jgi:ABC-2 type transport system permease protein